MNTITPFTPKAVARKSAGSLASAILANATTGGFPVVSIKGKVFHVVRDSARTLVTKPGEDDPAPSLEVVIVGANPHRSRVYYATGYEEGSNAKPDCYSNDGKGPAADAVSPQAKSCATCVHAQFGSKTSESGQKGFACANSQRLAVSPIGSLSDPMMLRIPGASLKAFTEFVREVARAGYDLDEVATKIGFDYSVAHPALTFKAVGVLPGEMVATVRAQGSSELVSQIIGTSEVPLRDMEAFETNAPKLSAPKAAPEADTDELGSVLTKAEAKPKPRAAVKVESAPAKKVEMATVDSLGDDLDSLLDGTDFDV